MADPFDRTFIAAFVQLDPAAVLPASGRVQFVDGRFGTVRWMIKHPPYLVLISQVDGETDPSMSLASQVIFVETDLRRVAVARIALVVPDHVTEVDVTTVQKVLADRVAAQVLEVATLPIIGVIFWQVGNDIYLDDPETGPPVNIADLDYNDGLGLHRRRQ